MKQPKVSVLLGVLNQEVYLPACIESVLEQTFSDFEFIILNDGSTDRTWEIIQDYAKKDSRIRPFSFPEKQGIAVGCNFTVAQARGEYLARIDGDDIWKPEKLLQQVEYLDQHPECGVCFTQVEVIDFEGNIISGVDCNGADQLFAQENKSQSQWLRQLFTSGNCLNHPSSVIRRSAFEKIGGYQNDFQQFPDFDLWLRLIQICEFYIIPEQLIRYRYITSSTSILSPNTVSRISQEYFQIYLRLFEKIDDKLFYDSFKDLFICADSITKAELQCEKAFLLLHHSFGVLPEPGKLAALTLFHDLLNQESMRRLLMEKYHFNQFDYIQLSAQPIFYSLSLFSPDSLLYKNIQTHTATVYYSQNDALDAEHCVQTKYQANHGIQKLTFLLPVKGIKTLRFDPLEDYGCVVWYFQATLNGKPLPAFPANGEQTGVWCFTNPDPQIYFRLEQPISGTVEILLGATPLLEPDFQNVTDTDSSVSISKERHMQQMDQLTRQNQHLTEEIQRLESALEQSNNQLQSTTEERNALRSQLDRIYQSKAYRAYAKLRHPGKK